MVHHCLPIVGKSLMAAYSRYQLFDHKHFEWLTITRPFDSLKEMWWEISIMVKAVPYFNCSNFQKTSIQSFSLEFSGIRSDLFFFPSLCSRFGLKLKKKTPSSETFSPSAVFSYDQRRIGALACGLFFFFFFSQTHNLRKKQKPFWILTVSTLVLCLATGEYRLRQVSAGSWGKGELVSPRCKLAARRNNTILLLLIMTAYGLIRLCIVTGAQLLSVF